MNNPSQSTHKILLQTTSEIHDLLHALHLVAKHCDLHFSQMNYQNNFVNQTFQFLEYVVSETTLQFNKRQTCFNDYLIIRQIQQEEQKNRIERLLEYQQKIYELRRLITDKQNTYETLLHPKRKKPSQINHNEFVQICRKQKAQLQKRNYDKFLNQKQQMKELLTMLECIKQNPNKLYQKSKNIRRIEFPQSNQTNDLKIKKPKMLNSSFCKGKIQTTNTSMTNEEQNYFDRTNSFQNIQLSVLKQKKLKRLQDEHNMQKWKSFPIGGQLSLMQQTINQKTFQISMQKLLKLKVYQKRIQKLKAENKRLYQCYRAQNIQTQIMRNSCNEYKNIYKKKSEQLFEVKKQNSLLNKQKQLKVFKLQQKKASSLFPNRQY